ncbi:hypothetical protein EGW08_002399 [Elysia chlorotica]|uniref:C-type lectin domain-containing protein n=1 Tax=Elysia chlorotica TaxID=188477 RepID=A0A3S1A3Q7_ELYCH|nr:hypothetical protein EGW08_002399 [Elysia chlorotica]
MSKLHVQLTGLCTPGSFLQSGTFGTALAPTSTEGDLFAPSRCDTSDGFTYVTSDEASACILASSLAMSPDGAAAFCFNLGAHLFVARTKEKLQLLPHDNGYIVGLSDVAVEGTFVWQDNGEQITDVYKLQFFNPAEPNNSGVGEDCVVVTNVTTMLSGNDIPCNFVYWMVACERPVYG